MRVINGRAQRFAASAVEFMPDRFPHETAPVRFLAIDLANDGFGQRDGDTLGGFHG